MAHKQGRFFWNLFTGNVVLLLAVVGACVLLIAKTFDASYDSILTDHLHTVARMLRNEYGDALHAGNVARLAEATRDLDANTVESVRVTFIDAAGRVLGDSQAEAARMESHADRDEVRQAMRDGIGERTRFSTTIQKEMKYVALRVGRLTRRSAWCAWPCRWAASWPGRGRRGGCSGGWRWWFPPPPLCSHWVWRGCGAGASRG
jgi:hypothetical protein